MYLRIRFNIHLRQHKNSTVCLQYVSLLKPLKVENHIKGITAYPHIQLFQGYSFEVAGYSVVTPSDQYSISIDPLRTLAPIQNVSNMALKQQHKA